MYSMEGGWENFEWLWRAEHTANTAIRDSVSAVALHVCFVCACLPAYFRFNRNYPLVTIKTIIRVAVHVRQTYGVEEGE